MSEDDIQPSRFFGRTYSRSRQSAASRAFDEAAGIKTVSTKSAVPISNCGKANKVSLHEDFDDANKAKKVKIEKMRTDPFSFDTEDKRKLVPETKETILWQQELHQFTSLPASRIDLKNKDCETPESKVTKSQKFHNSFSICSQKPIITDLENGKNTASEQPLFFSEARIATCQDVQKDEDSCPVKFVNVHPTYPSTSDKVDSPMQRRPGYVAARELKDTKCVTASDHELIEDCKPKSQLEKYFIRNSKHAENFASVTSDRSAYQEERSRKNGNSDSTTSTLNRTETILTRTKTQFQNVSFALANSSKGTLSPKESSSNPPYSAPTRYVTHRSGCNIYKAQESAILPESSLPVDNNFKRNGSLGLCGKSYRIFKSRAPQGEEFKSHVFQLKAEEDKTACDNSESPVSSQSSLSSDISSHSDVSLGRGGKQYRIFKSHEFQDDHKPHVFQMKKEGKTACDKAESPVSSKSSLSPDTSCHSDASGRGGKQYRIFKSRSHHFEKDIKPLVFHLKEDEKKWPQSSSKKEMVPSGDSQVLSMKDETVLRQTDLVLEEESQSPARSLDSSQISYFGEQIDAANLELDANVKEINPSTARELLAARLRNIEKDNDSESIGDMDNVSECSEILQSQETLSNSQNILEGGSQKESPEIAPRKFFKTKSFIGSSDLERRIFGSSHKKTSSTATYNARSWHSEHESDTDKEEHASKSRKIKHNDDDIILMKKWEKGPKLKREVHWPERKYDEAYTSLKVSQSHKKLYTVVHNVKQTHEVQELGETQDFMDEVDYLLDSLRNTNSTSIRCLSCLKLASKCISPAFRMHMRAHGTVSKIFNLLQDACSNPSLALSTSAIMFMLSRDRLNMDLDRDSLSLMLKLNEVDGGDKASLDVICLQDLEKTEQKVKELLAQLQLETHAREIDLGFVSTGNLSLESLLSLTSRRAGEWFKEELRSVGGLDHIVDSVKFCENSLPEDLSQDIQKTLPVLRKLDRCLRVLENISYMNADNQNYLILYRNAMLLQACIRTLRLCQACIPTYKMPENLDKNNLSKDLPGYTLLTCILGVLRVMLNITHENQLTNVRLADEVCLMETVVRCLTMTLWCVPVEQRFDLAVLCLGLLINLVEHKEVNCSVMMDMETEVKYTEKSRPKSVRVVKAIVELFVQREQAAREMEEDAENASDISSVSSNISGEWKETDTSIQWITNSLNKAKEEQEKKTASGAVKKDSAEEVEGNQSILEDDEETFTKALHKAGRHMENSIVASYAGLLLGCIIKSNKDYALSVKKLIPNEDFGPMIKILKKFLNFMNLTTAIGSTDVNGITKVLEILESA